MTKGSKMVDPVTLWPVRSVSKSVTDEGARTSFAQPVSTSTRASGVSLSKLVTLSAELAKAGPPVDHAKVDQLRQSIARGEYQNDVDAIAHSMVRFFQTGE